MKKYLQGMARKGLIFLSPLILFPYSACTSRSEKAPGDVEEQLRFERAERAKIKSLLSNFTLEDICRQSTIEGFEVDRGWFFYRPKNSQYEHTIVGPLSSADAIDLTIAYFEEAALASPYCPTP